MLARVVETVWVNLHPNHLQQQSFGRHVRPEEQPSSLSNPGSSFVRRAYLTRRMAQHQYPKTRLREDK